MGKTKLGDTLRAARRASGMTLQQLEVASGVGFRTIQAIEVGESEVPKKDTLRALAEALHPYATIEELALAAYDADDQGRDSPPEVSVPRKKAASNGGMPTHSSA